MELVEKYLKKDETIQKEYRFSTMQSIKNFFVSKIIYVIMWVVLFATSVYFLFRLLSFSSDYWFVIITPAGFVVVKLWTLVYYFLKVYEDNNKCGYVLTDKALYYYNNGKHKKVIRVAFKDITVVEKADYYFDGFYVTTKDDYILVNNIKEKNNLFEEMLQKVKTDIQ